jgi:hypothetical protein
MAGMHHALVLASRILAGIVAGISFYFAFFLYEDEEGVWQNRIENLWVSIYDRAKITESTSAALFNKFGDTLRKWFNYLFGKRLLSFRAFITSFNLSQIGSSIWYLYQQIDLHPVRDHPLYFVFMLVFTAFCELLLCVAVLAAHSELLIARVFSFLPFLVACGGAILSFLIHLDTLRTLMWLLVAIVLSVFSDYLAIVIIRKLFAALARTLSLLRLAITMIILSTVCALVCITPFLSSWSNSNGEFNSIILPRPFIYLLTHNLVGVVRGVAALNISTAILCLIPVAMLAVILIHKIIWPTLGRLLYPIASRRIVTDRKILIPIGTLALTFAFNLEHVGAKELLKLLS